MAVHFTGNDSDGILLTTSSELWINAAGTYVTNAGDAFSFGTTTDNRLLVDGRVLSENGDAIVSEFNSYASRVTVSATGMVEGFSDGIELEDVFNVVTNYGIIAGLGDTGVEMRGEAGTGNSTVYNFGYIFGQSEGVTMIGSGNDVTNSGEIMGNVRGVEFLSADNVSLNNSGTIQGDTALAITGSAGTTSLTVNSGTIAGRVAFTSGLGDETIENSGIISGSISLSAGDDVVRNVGIISGSVNLGSGADRYVGRGSQADAIEVLAGAGDDVVRGGDSGLTMYGEGDNDELSGGAGVDEIYGGTGSDTLQGGGNDDVLDGGSGDDSIGGGGGDDEIFGGLGTDVLFGKDGDDTLTGGAGADILYGGAGADWFVYTAASDSAGTVNDTIHDFGAGDLIDLSLVSAQQLSFMGKGALAGGGVASLNYNVVGSGLLRIIVDTDGNGTTDMRIFLSGIKVVDADDFIL